MSSPSGDIETKIARLQDHIITYTTGSTFRFSHEKPANPPDILRIGLFGPTGVGKSALVNSMNFATKKKGERGFLWESISPEGYSLAASKTLSRQAFYIAEKIAVYDNRGMKDLGGRFVVELRKQIAGVYGDEAQAVKWDVTYIRALTEGLEKAFYASKEFSIHCTVLVVSAVNLTIKASDLTVLFAQIKKMTGSPPIVVITHRKDPSVREEDIISFTSDLQVSKFDYVYQIENYTRDDNEYDPKKHLSLLEIIQQCTIVGDKVMKFKETNGGCVIL